MIQLLGSVFGHDASTWNFGASPATAGAINSAQMASDGTIFISPLPAPAATDASIVQCSAFERAQSRGERCSAGELAFSDLAQDFGRVLSKTRGRLLGGRSPAVDDYGCAHARNRPVLGGLARKVELHAAMLHLRVVKFLLKIVDRSRRHLLRFELLQQLVAFHAGGESGQFSNKLLAVFQPSNIVFVGWILSELGRTEGIAKFYVLIVVSGGDNHMSVGNRENLIGHDIGVRVADAFRHIAGDEIVHGLV